MIPVVLPQRYMASPHISMESRVEGGNFHLSFDFRNHKNKPNRFDFVFDFGEMRRMIGKFRFPRSMMNSGLLTSHQMQLWKQRQEQALREGMFKITGRMLVPDYDAIVSYYAPVYCKPVAAKIKATLQQYGTDTRRERIEMAMKFVQDIPYGIPTYNDPDYMYGGILTPPQILYYNYGDCDSKSLLFAGILSYLITPGDLCFLLAPNHLFVGIREAAPEKGMTYAEVGGNKYVFAETAGPARYNFGQACELNMGKLQFFPFSYNNGNLGAANGNLTEQLHKQSATTVPHVFSAAPEIAGTHPPDGGYRFDKPPKSAPLNGFVQTLRKVSKQSTAIKSIVFNDRGGWAILSDNNKVAVSDIPERMDDDLQKVIKEDAVIADLALADDNRFVVVYHNGYGFAGNFAESGRLLEALNEITEKRGLPVFEVEFAHNELGGGWAVLYGKNGEGFDCFSPNAYVESTLRADLEEAAKKGGLRSIAFAQQNGWVVLHGKNSVMIRLTEEVGGELRATLAQLQKNGAQIDRIYFTATNDWVIIFNGHEFSTSIYNEE